MKRIPFFFLLLFLLLRISTYAQVDYAPIGAEWYYGSTGNDNFPHYAHYVVNRDTIIQGQGCRIIEGIYYPASYDTPVNDPVFDATKVQYVYSSGDTVFYYNSFFSTFLPLYIFNVAKGDTVIFHSPVVDPQLDVTLSDTFFRVLIKDVDTLWVDDVTGLKRIWTEALDTWRFNAEYYTERIGSPFYPMGQHSAPAMIPELAERSLRCYNDDQITFQFSSLSCTYLPASIESVSFSSAGFEIYPNPIVHGPFTIRLNKKDIRIKQVELWDLAGRMVATSPARSSSMEIKCDFNVPAGTYIVRLVGEQYSFSENITIIH